MTEGIWIAIIGAAGLLLAAVVPPLFKKKAVKNPPQEVAVEAPRNQSPQATHNRPEPEAPVARRKIGLSHKQISDAIEAVPPFQQEKIREDFIGRWVTWQTQLSGVYRVGDVVTVSAKIPEGDGVLFCDATPVACDGFIVAHAGTQFTVTGQIERISRYEARLKNCEFEIPQAVA